MRPHDTSLREAVGAIGFTPAGLKQFLMATLTSPRSVEQLDAWYARYVGPHDDAAGLNDPRAALNYLVRGLPSGKRREFARQVLTAVARGYDESGETYPQWLVELQTLYAGDSVETGSGGTRRSAMGKYAHLDWSSDDYARRKQDEIDLEDGRAA